MAFVTGQVVTENNVTDASNQRSMALSGVTAGNALIVAIRVTAGAAYQVSTVSSNLDGVLTKLTDIQDAAIRFYTWYLENASAGTHTLTLTTGGASQTVRWTIAEYDNVPSSGIIDNADSAAFSTTTTPTTSNVTTTGASRVIVSAIATDLGATTIVPADGETERTELNDRLQLQDEAAATAGDYSASWTLGTTQPGIWAILALKQPVDTTKYLKLLAHSSAASATGVEGVVLNAARDTVIGEFTGQAFEATLEGSPGEAVLLIDVADITPDGDTLTTSDTPIVFAYNTTDGTVGEGSATVIEV
jgi:hypothetical protein